MSILSKNNEWFIHSFYFLAERMYAKYISANGQITVEHGVYAPIQEKEGDEYASEVLIRTHFPIHSKEQEQDKRRNENVE
jgi:hypothetical protein